MSLEESKTVGQDCTGGNMRSSGPKQQGSRGLVVDEVTWAMGNDLSTIPPLHDGMMSLQRAFKDMVEEAEKSSYWLVWQKKTPSR